MSLKSALQWRKLYYKDQFYKLVNYLLRFYEIFGKEEIKSVSVVVVGRNDNYGGDFSKRLQVTLDWNLSHLPNPELIYVEWNPLSDRPSDCTWISERYKNSKCFIVPNEIHKVIAHDPEKMKVMEYFAKNLGIRKASSDWIILTNADVLIGPDMIGNIKSLNKDFIYGGHYVNILWDGDAIDEYYFKDKKIVKNSFSAYLTFQSTVGNFILTNKKNWMTSTGYDENLNKSRAGVDTNGYLQLKKLNLITRIIGHHFHLDHPESIINVANLESHGDRSQMIDNRNIPYKNREYWGLADYPLKQISEKIWELQAI